MLVLLFGSNHTKRNYTRVLSNHSVPTTIIVNRKPFQPDYVKHDWDEYDQPNYKGNYLSEFSCNGSDTRPGFGLWERDGVKNDCRLSHQDKFGDCA